jgi:4-carboxymuconolactone decarboxylase
MDEYKQHLNRLAVHDEMLLTALAANGGGDRIIDARTEALVRLGAMIAVGAPSASFQYAVSSALAAGATVDEIVASLGAVTPVTGAPRVVECAPKVAFAVGYDVEDALEQFSG